eukprot:4164553-Prymnesium_polylepis.1
MTGNYGGRPVLRLAKTLASDLRRRARERDYPVNLDQAAPGTPNEGDALRRGVQQVRGVTVFLANRVRQDAVNMLGYGVNGLGYGAGVLASLLLDDRDPGDPGDDPDPEPQSGGFHKKKRPRFTGRGFRLGETPPIPGGGFTPWDQAVAFEVPDRGHTPYETHVATTCLGRRWRNRSYAVSRRVTSEYNPEAPGQLITQPPEIYREPLVRVREVLRQAVPYPELLGLSQYRQHRHWSRPTTFNSIVYSNLQVMRHWPQTPHLRAATCANESGDLKPYHLRPAEQRHTTAMRLAGNGTLAELGKCPENSRMGQWPHAHYALLLQIARSVGVPRVSGPSLRVHEINDIVCRGLVFSP